MYTGPLAECCGRPNSSARSYTRDVNTQARTCGAGAGSWGLGRPPQVTLGERLLPPAAGSPPGVADPGLSGEARRGSEGPRLGFQALLLYQQMTLWFGGVSSLSLFLISPKLPGWGDPIPAIPPPHPTPFLLTPAPPP